MSEAHGPQVEVAAAFVAARAGVSAGGPRQAELLARVAVAMAEAGTTSAEQFCALLDHDRAMFDELVVALTVAESYFFRESPQIDLLRHQVLPERVLARGHRGTLRLWSAGCAHGQEAYTLAILLEEAGLSTRSRVLATDLSPQALEAARSGVYGKWSLRTVDDFRRRTYFRPVAGGFRVAPRLDRLITFDQHNLLDATFDPRMTDMDVVLCRNVLVYFTPDAVKEVGRRLVASLAPGGWLLTAATDPHLDTVQGLQTLVTPAGVVYRRLIDASASASASASGSADAVTPPRDHLRRHRRHGTSIQGRSSTPISAQVRPSALPSAPADGQDRDPLGLARRALADGEYEVAADRARELVADGNGGDGEAAVVLIRALGSAGRLADAADAAAQAVAQLPLHVELRLLQAIVLVESDRPQEAAAAAKAALYVDPDLAMAHLTLARADQARGDGVAATRSYRNALALLEALPADQPVRLADGDTAGRLAGLARAGQGPAHRPVRATTP